VKPKHKIETLAVHAGHAVDPSTGAVSPPIHLSSTFERAADGTYASGYIYSRDANPNRNALEQAVAAVEGGAVAAAFGSGMGAISAVFQSLAPGDHVIVASDAYHGTAKVVRNVHARWGLVPSFVDASDAKAIAAELRANTKLVWIETPSNPLLKIVDIAEIAGVARAGGAKCVCDNTLAPIIQRPLDLGADLVMHSTTKYIGGHSDVLGGVLVSKENDEFLTRVREIQASAGAVPSPFDCWLILRGLQTLPWRIRGHSDNGMAVAHFLAAHPAVERVYYPGLESHPRHDIAARQMSAFGGMISIEVKGGREAAVAVAAKVRIFTRATSLGGVESLIEHRASIAGEDPRTPQTLLRLSVGLENAEDLIEDLAQALG
jgi:cystathionine gamma-synthase